MAGCRVRKDSVKFVDTLVTVSPEFAKAHESEMPEYFNRAFDFLKERVGEENIISAVVHMDEKTPHLHLCFVPLTKDKRLSAKEILGNKKSMIRWQDDFYAYMAERVAGAGARHTCRGNEAQAPDAAMVQESHGDGCQTGKAGNCVE